MYLYDVIALIIYLLALLSISKPSQYINKWAIKELREQKNRQDNINKNYFLADVKRNESEYASVNSRIYQARVFIYGTFFAFALLLSHIVYKIIFVNAKFLVLPFFLFLTTMLIIKTYQINMRD